MVGNTAPHQNPAEDNFIGIIGNWRSWRFGQAVRRGFRENRHLPVASLFLAHDGWILPETRLSDHASFWDAGLPGVIVTDTAFFRNPNYHLSSDTIDLSISRSWRSSSKALNWRCSNFALPEAPRDRPAIAPNHADRNWRPQGDRVPR